MTSPDLAIHPLERLSVVLVSPRNTLNIGAVARAMSNFGALDLRLADIFYKNFRSAASAVGPSAQLLASAAEYPTIAGAVADAQLVVGTSGAEGRGWTQPAERLEVGAARMRAALDAGQRVALVFGSEKFGLSSEDVTHCHLLMRIPTREEHPSMNLGQAAALCLYELARVGPKPAVLAEPPLAPAAPAHAEALERMTALLTQVLLASELPGLVPGARTRFLRSLVRRLQLSESDTHVITGFLRQMVWKLGSAPAQPTTPEK